ncbi:siderophore-interacting protein [Saccharomonospora sp. NPDC046836]|uniref:siderophore-interacting protein n=1 Tax=Saccharomonospora sp. NPDC046836 TaxID=3156921 RepID=UPI0033CA59BA
MAFTDGRKIGGLYTAEVLRTDRVTPHMVRVTFTGEDLKRLPVRGYDQWFRLFLPRRNGQTDFAAVPERFGMAGYLKYLTAKSGTRPPFRNYTVRELRPDLGELDVDFVAHGDQGIAGPWARRAQAGERVALIDQGRGFDPIDDAGFVLLAGDESALPAIAGILRSLPRSTAGLAIIEIPTADDMQSVEAPCGVEVRWLARTDPHERPGILALEAVHAYSPAQPASLQAYLAGEQRCVAESRRHLVTAGVPKSRIAFTGYWKVGRAG